MSFAWTEGLVKVSPSLRLLKAYLRSMSSLSANTVELPRPRRQRTLARQVDFNGVGLHTGKIERIVVKPAKENSGISFALTGNTIIPAKYDHVELTELRTVLSTSIRSHKARSQKEQINTVEHLMAAFAACQIDNAVVECSGNELPAMDGSSLEYINTISGRGTLEQDAHVSILEIKQPIQVLEREKSVSFLPLPHTGSYPYPTLLVTVEVDFEGRLPGKHWFTTSLPSPEFVQEVAPARTFAFMEDVEAMKKMGLALGGSLDNAVVFSSGKAMNEGGLRFDNEWVRHKALDCVGDLALVGSNLVIHGHYVGIRPGHGLNNRLLRALFATPDAYSINS